MLLPVMLPMAWLSAPTTFDSVGAPAWLGLAEGGIAAVARLQLFQPLIGLMLAAVLLNEPVTAQMQIAAAAVIFRAIGARKFSS
jgi:positive regulator of sigma E activity